MSPLLRIAALFLLSLTLCEAVSAQPPSCCRATLGILDAETDGMLAADALDRGLFLLIEGRGRRSVKGTLHTYRVSGDRVVGHASGRQFEASVGSQFVPGDQFLQAKDGAFWSEQVQAARSRAGRPEADALVVWFQPSDPEGMQTRPLIVLLDAE